MKISNDSFSFPNDSSIFFFNNHNNFAQINGKRIKPYQQNEQRENKDTKLVPKKNCSNPLK
jgi:hypothetical protein